MPNWDVDANWQLAFFNLPDVAEHFTSGKEREMLAWYFFHTSYSGMEAISQDVLNRYATSISKPGFLRACFGYFAATTVAADASFFNATLRSNPLAIPVLAIGGESNIAPVSVIEELWGPVGTSVTCDVVPKAGHWIGRSMLVGEGSLLHWLTVVN